MVVMDAFLALSVYFISQCLRNPAVPSPQWDIWFSRLPATCEQNVLDGQEAFHSLLFLLLSFMPVPLMHAAACHTQGKTTWKEIRWDLFIRLHGNPSTKLFVLADSFLYFGYKLPTGAIFPWKYYDVKQMLLTCFNIAPKWMLAHLQSASICEIRTSRQMFWKLLTLNILC